MLSIIQFQTLCRLQFPTYSTYVRPQDAITTDILLKNKMTLPEAAVQKSEVKRIERKTMGIEDQVTKLFDQPKGRRQNSKKDLKVRNIVLNKFLVSYSLYTISVLMNRCYWMRNGISLLRMKKQNEKCVDQRCCTVEGR